MSDQINSSKAPEPVGLYPHARRVGNLLFLSGVGPRERGTKKIPGVELDEKGNIVSYDIEKQCRSVFQNVLYILCLLYTSPSPRDRTRSRMPSSA